MNVNYATAAQKYQSGDYMGALGALNHVLNSQQDAKTYSLLARTFLKLDMKSEAAAAFALAGREEGPAQNENLRNAMLLHFECGNEDDALMMAKHFMSKAREDVDVAYVLASIFLKRGEKPLLKGLRKPLLESKNPNHLSLAMRLLADDPGDEENFKTIKKVIKLVPDSTSMRLLYLIHAREFCEFEEIREHQPIIDRLVAKDTQILKGDNPFYHLMWCGDESLNRHAAINTRGYKPGVPQFRRQLPHDWSGEKIRIGYLSYDFWDTHATMKLLANVLEQHDRDRFDITLFCYTPEKKLQENEVDREKWGRIVRIEDLSNEEAAKLIRREKIDILVDLKGHTKGSRAAILNLAPAPIHVSWLGFPGTTINIDIDYIIGDHFVLPESSKPHYYEKFVRLPEAYQPNDPVSRPALKPYSRKDLGLPEDAFVFASFNGNRKISVETIETWAKILRRTGNSVIWILGSNARAQTNIVKEMKRRGVSSKRVLFTPKVLYDEHINRIQAADLGLDTWPYNGHTTTSEQLWAGLPVLTLKGSNFASRVSETLLNAIGMPELVASDKENYVDTAVSLFEDPAKMADCKQRLVENRFVKPLFDSERFCRHLENAFEMMFARAKNGHDPDHMDVPALPPRDRPFIV